MTAIMHHTLYDGRRIAFRLTPGAGPCLVFLPGYMSDMSGGKATALFAEAEARGRACLLLDYSGCGQSGGDFAEGMLSKWRDEVLALVESYVAGPVLLVGSSMGGWLMLLVAEHLKHRLAGLVGIAPAPDFTRWGYSEAQRAALAAGETIYEDNPYGPEPTPTHPGFFADAECHLRLDGAIGIACPVRLLHGKQDADVPWEISLRLKDALASAEVQVTLVEDGDHRLSRPGDIDRLKAIVAEFYG
ncbi:alpha/beta fold hydrolase [Porphyrobacter sp. CACIAM 03H1]|jgi:pimeloyl-ACP methyl ester carboxylesterase|uniref:alpha/beta fold hydrolase n=1 Tax=Porphyrobacter sp. CACIAM 03H1 TaxID=2003315 RepID=UPI000B5A4407|nr:alpha/beta hydrolase [Porphyrobacter sp. CACIAM 03H1]ASJ89885.1 alpha/beta hydrolase [Porphyrobacter sp. CACIAM 03H1]